MEYLTTHCFKFVPCFCKPNRPLLLTAKDLERIHPTARAHCGVNGYCINLNELLTGLLTDHTAIGTSQHDGG
jgi:hypothetical protein